MLPRLCAAAVVMALALTLVLCVPGRDADMTRLAVEWLLAAIPAVLAALGRPVARG